MPSDKKHDSRRADGYDRDADVGATDEAAQVSVIRSSYATLQSDLFTWSRCSVFVSCNGRSMLVSPSPSGKTEVTGDTIRVPGLNRLSPFSEPCDLEYSMQGDDILITLPEPESCKPLKQNELKQKFALGEVTI